MADEITHIRLSELNQQIQTGIEQYFGSNTFWVVADITNHSFKEKSNYHYFDLVEKAENSNQLLAKIAGKAWGAGSNKIRAFEQITGQKFTNNINVLVNVMVKYHPSFGLSLEVQDISTHFTLGMLEQQRQDTLNQLVVNNPGIITKVGERYITRNAQKTLPKVIQRIAVVSSQTSAGNEDFQHTLSHNPYGYQFQVDNYFTIVQNEINAEVFLQRLIDVFNSHIPYDVVVIIRGGGAQTDFLIFDNYKIGLAVARFPIPIITGIGHQKNETIADLMAHTQTKTPTECAKFIILHNKQFEDALLQLQQSILIKSQQLFSARYQRLSVLNSFIVNQSRTQLNQYKDALIRIHQVVTNNTKTLVYHHKSQLMMMASTLISKPGVIVSNHANNLSNVLSNLKTFNAGYLKNQRGYLGHYVSVIKLMSPDNILKKGFAMIKHRGQIVGNPNNIKPGDAMEVILLNTRINTTVHSKTTYDGSEFNV